MFTISVRLLHETIRAGASDDTVEAGGTPVAEWPPSPARLFSALVAGDGTGDRCTATTGEELEWLEKQQEPWIVASPKDEILDTQLLERFVVKDQTLAGVVQEYVARQAIPVRSGLRIAPKSTKIIYVWPDASPSDKDLKALRYRAARVGYFGCSDSPVQLQVERNVKVSLDEAWRPSKSGDIVKSGDTILPVPYDGFLNALDKSFRAWTNGEPGKRSWVPTRYVNYRWTGQDEDLHRPQIIWLRFDRPVSGRKLIAVTDTLRKAVTEHLQRILGEENVSPLIHGHRKSGETGDQVTFLALPDVGYPYSTGKLFGAAIVIPEEADDTFVNKLNRAILTLSHERLVKPRYFDLKVEVHGGEQKPWAASPKRWTSLAKRWVSATPVVHEHWTKKQVGIEEAQLWCSHTGLPSPVTVEFSRYPLVSGGLDLPPSLVFRDGRKHYPYSHVLIEFERPVKGPVVLGRSRHFGLGLFVPYNPKEGGIQ